jgi:RNase H-fold protein (predicted Holliday junction resolvase)
MKFSKIVVGMELEMRGKSKDDRQARNKSTIGERVDTGATAACRYALMDEKSLLQPNASGDDRAKLPVNTLAEKDV